MKRLCLISCLFLVLTNVAPALASVDYYTINGKEVAIHTQGALLSNAPDYEWWYGCSPTAAGMMMGYYDINGYGSLYYSNLVPGGTAELSSYGAPGAIANDAIASQEHIEDFYVGGYLDSGDDVPSPRDPSAFNCLADFMGTSQDSVGNLNGSTTFYFNKFGSRIYAKDIYAVGPSYYESSGMFGMYEYFDYCGYGSGNPDTDINFYNQYIDTNVPKPFQNNAFSFNDYMNEIDAGRVVMIHVEGHSMFGYGYDEADKLVYLHDTWNLSDPENLHSMTWGGTYPYEDIEGNIFLLQHFGVTCYNPTGGVVPVPATVILLGSGLLALVGLRRRVRVREGDG